MMSAVAQTATIYTFSIDLSGLERGVYETLDFRVARRPSETLEYMATRILVVCLEYQDGIALTDGVSSGDEPALLVSIGEHTLTLPYAEHPLRPDTPRRTPRGGNAAVANQPAAGTPRRGRVPGPPTCGACRHGSPESRAERFIAASLVHTIRDESKQL